MVNDAGFERNKSDGRYATARNFMCSIVPQVVPLKATEMQDISAHRAGFTRHASAVEFSSAAQASSASHSFGDE